MKHQPTEAQKAKAEERRAALKALWSKVAEMSEEQRAAFADRIGVVTTCEGHPLTPNNTILLAYQMDNVTVVGGYNQWKSNGRQVKKGEKSLGIWIPCQPKDKESNNEEKPNFFIFGSVFDISQTDPIQ